MFPCTTKQVLSPLLIILVMFNNTHTPLATNTTRPTRLKALPRTVTLPHTYLLLKAGTQVGHHLESNSLPTTFATLRQVLGAPRFSILILH